MQNAEERREQMRRNEYGAMLSDCGATNSVVQESNDKVEMEMHNGGKEHLIRKVERTVYNRRQCMLRAA
jgi:hypothetical protein